MNMTSPVPAQNGVNKDSGSSPGGRFQQIIGFKENGAVWAWSSLVIVMIAFCFISAPTIGVGASDADKDTMAPGEFYHHRGKKLRLVLHVVSMILWSILGMVQFVPKVRKVALGYHRWAGRIYLICTAILAVTGLMMAPYSFGGNPTSQLAAFFIFLSFVISAVMGLIRVKQGFIQEHRAWMLRNYASGTAVLWSRVTIPLGGALAKVHSYWMVMQCSEISYELDYNPDRLLEYFPGCVGADSSWVAVKAEGPSTVNDIAGFRMGYDIGLWLGLIINMCGIELWIRFCKHLQHMRQEKVGPSPPAIRSEAAVEDGAEAGKVDPAQDAAYDPTDG